MRMNRLRGSVADRPIDSTVVQDEQRQVPLMQRIMAREPHVEHIDVKKRPQYGKG